MTGEDMILQAVAKMLSDAHPDTHSEMRRLFWIAGRCEHCAAPHDGGSVKCSVCGSTILNRDLVANKATEAERLLNLLESVGDMLRFPAEKPDAFDPEAMRVTVQSTYKFVEAALRVRGRGRS